MRSITTARQNGANGRTVAGADGQLLSFQELGSKAASFLRGGWWLRSTRLALTGATPAQLLTEEVTGGGGSSLPDARTLGQISRAALDQDDCSRIMQVLHKRLAKFDKNLWRESYKALIVVEQLLIHGPHGVADELQGDTEVICEMSTLQYIDEKGFNWGLTVKNKSEKVLKLLQDPSFLHEQRDRDQKISHEIQGFGSFNLTFSSTSSKINQHYTPPPFIARSNSHYESISTEESDSESDGGGTSWRSELGLETDESSELFLTQDEEPKRRGVPESSFYRDVLHMNSNRSEFKHCSAAKDAAFLSDNDAVEESEPFLPRREAKRVNDADMADHPFGFDRQGRESSFLLLSS